MNKTCIKKPLAVAAILLFISMSVAQSTETVVVEKTSLPTNCGKTLYVGGTGEGNYTRIQDAIDDASDGDTVFVYSYSSPYYENLIVDKSINLIGENKDTTVIDGSNKEDVVYISADWVYISGFTILQYGHYHDGIEISSNHNTITGNNISSNGQGDGISLGWYYSSNTITGNNISNNYEGIHLGYSSNSNTITGNNISNNDYGIDIYYSSGNTITGNSFFNDGLWAGGHYQKNVFNNTVNGKPLVYLEDESDMVLELDAGQVILVNCDNITVHNQELSNTTVGIELLNTDNCLISSNTISLNNRRGIFMEDSRSNTITGNNITSNKKDGIWLSGSSSNTITYNDISNNEDGIDLSYPSGRNIIEGNNITSNDWNGLELFHSYSNTIIKNNFIDNNKHHASFTINSVQCKNTWMQNYWNRPRLLPKIIFGGMEIRLNSYILTIPWIQFDRHPAQEPYDIGV